MELTIDQILEKFCGGYEWVDVGIYDKVPIENVKEAIRNFADQQVSIAVQKSLEIASENAIMVAVHNGKSRDIIIDKQSILSLAPQIIDELKKD